MANRCQLKKQSIHGGWQGVCAGEFEGWVGVCGVWGGLKEMLPGPSSVWLMWRTMALLWPVGLTPLGSGSARRERRLHVSKSHDQRKAPPSPTASRPASGPLCPPCCTFNGQISATYENIHNLTFLCQGWCKQRYLDVQCVERYAWCIVGVQRTDTCNQLRCWKKKKKSLSNYSSWQ